MTYTLDFALALGSGKTGLTDLRAQLVDTAGSDVGSAVSAGFVEIGSGNYLWHYASIPDDHRGGVKFYSNATPATILAFAAINPEEAEHTDAKISGISGDSAPSAEDNAAAVRVELATELAHLDADVSSIGGGLSAQETRDAMMLAPTAGAAAAGSVDAHLDAIQAKTDTIGALSVTITAPVSTTGTDITIIRGDDYLFGDGRELSFTGTNWPVITAGAIALRIGTPTVTEIAGVITGADACYVQLTDTQTAALDPGTYTYDLQATLVGGSVITLVQGTLNVTRDV